MKSIQLLAQGLDSKAAVGATAAGTGVAAQRFLTDVELLDIALKWGSLFATILTIAYIGTNIYLNIIKIKQESGDDENKVGSK